MNEEPMIYLYKNYCLSDFIFKHRFQFNKLFSLLPILQSTPKAAGIIFDDFLKKEEGFEKQFKELLSDYRLIFDKTDPESILSTITFFKRHESFKGRVLLSEYKNLLDFENLIYFDKKFEYSEYSNYNKRVIPDFISSTFSELFYEGVIELTIRKDIQQYSLGILSSYDYQFYAHYSQITNAMEFREDIPSFFAVWGSVPLIFNDREAYNVLKRRLDVANCIRTKTGLEKKLQGLESLQIHTRKEVHQRFQKAKEKKDYNLHEIYQGNHIEEISDPDSIWNKNTTKNYLDVIFNELKTKNTIIDSQPYNLIITVSTFNVLKIVSVIERYFFNHPEIQKPNSLLLICDSTFFNLLATYRSVRDEHINISPLEIKKEIKCLLFDLFMHLLDKNNNKAV